MSAHATEPQRSLQQLEKENRILRKKIERAKATNRQLEETTRKKESLLRRVIEDLKDSQTSLKQKSNELEHAYLNLKDTQAQLIHAEKMSSLGQLVAGIAHEINNPVNFIHGNLKHLEDYAVSLVDFLQLYEKYYPEPIAEIQKLAREEDISFIKGDLVKVLSSMQIGTERICEIVLSLRNFSRMDEADRKFVDIHEGIESTLLILQHRLKAEHHRPEITIIRDFGTLPLVECFAGQLNQVVMNILSNAIDAIDSAWLTAPIDEKQPQLLLRTQAKADSVSISISDNGTGMPSAVRQRIFDPFFTTKAVGKGTGMGMAISYQLIAEKHGGTLECFSEEGAGTEFVITLPIKPKS